MAYLNWKDSSATLVQVASHSIYGTQLILRLLPEQLQELIAELQDLYLQGGSELRVRLPQDWIMFWKRRDDGSRCLLAHPEKNDWVGTVALDPLAAEKVLFALKTLEVGRSLVLSELCVLDSVSNLEVSISAVLNLQDSPRD